MSLGNLAEYDILNFLFVDIAIPTRNTLWLGLSSGEPLEDGSNKYELSGGNYDRVSFSGIHTFSPPSNGQIINTGEILFNEATTDWSGITNYFISSSGTAGETNNTLLSIGQFATTRTIYNGDRAAIQSNEITINV